MNFQFSIFNFQSQKGQGLLETVIALSVIITGLVGALALAVNNLASTSDSGMRVVAGNLAREGVEIVKNIRDSNWLAGRQWDEGIFLGSSYDKNDHTATAEFAKNLDQWNLNFIPDTLGAQDTKLKRDNFLYNYAAGVDSPFSRLLTLDEICGEDNPPAECVDGICGEGYSCEKTIGIRILSRVRWIERGNKHNIIIEDRLYNWK